MPKGDKINFKEILTMKVLRLKELRTNANYTQIEMAKLLNVPQSSYSRWESGVRFPDAQQIIKLCEVLKCTPNDIFGIKGEYEVATKDWI